MSTNKFTMKQYNGTDFDIYYPKTVASQVEGIQLSSFVSNVTLDADDWSSEGSYSFETEYPFSSYDVEVIIAPTADAEERDAYAEAMMTGSPTSNIITALGTVPIIDIPVYLKITTK